MNILIIDNGSHSLTPLLDTLKAHAVSIATLSDFDFSAPSTALTDLIIVPGASQYAIVDNPVRFAKEIHFVQQTTTPLLGICFGAELLAHAYGSPIHILSDKVSGVREVDVLLPHHHLFAGKVQLQVHESHRYSIKSTQPPLKTLAVSDTGVEIFEHTSKRQLGMQFHPESLAHTADGGWLLSRAVHYLTGR